MVHSGEDLSDEMVVNVDALHGFSQGNRVPIAKPLIVSEASSIAKKLLMNSLCQADPIAVPHTEDAERSVVLLPRNTSKLLKVGAVQQPAKTVAGDPVL